MNKKYPAAFEKYWSLVAAFDNAPFSLNYYATKHIAYNSWLAGRKHQRLLDERNSI